MPKPRKSNRTRIGLGAACVILAIGAFFWSRGLRHPSFSSDPHAGVGVPEGPGGPPWGHPQPGRPAAPQFAPAPSPGASLAQLASRDRLMGLLDELLASRNDNDPRLDTEFRQLDEPTREAMREKYRSFKAERRAERGLVVYLLGREPSVSDRAFFEEVLKETPCLSLADCSRPAQGGDPHLASADQVTLAYPQLVALRQLERAVDPETRALVQAGLRSANPLVREAAEAAVRRLGIKN